MVGGRQHMLAGKGVAVQEIGFARHDQRMLARRADIVPAHMRNFRRRITWDESRHAAGNPAQAPMLAHLIAGVSEQLHTHANA